MDARHSDKFLFFCVQVKQIMEEAVTKKFVHEDSSHIIALCSKYAFLFFSTHTNAYTHTHCLLLFLSLSLSRSFSVTRAHLHTHTHTHTLVEVRSR